ncbi:6-phosphofructo-2-kinase KNAG_0E01930 [Huiozyma naganishii CBS 8797]|uniref:6-phosphofructo-2-kinase domain-containing protein n=1 Tax=Huiozyma naganishii (strain ATCC MYA-139 / BCRC 22969 / CBS 8797 / KCTC 17520 / NBRC 10181 / NCYC 3082 / Yp74L-3) TaxID=1071383 RepID=J7R6I0_HUIN7|nr:hypothetical protein KNAG_0E01930 [Kazachstania naganishii CBS 8797]CCK70455.1 hypothetical protein KNAG_0E01930 [Kazachstania naganishii CBS 8797]
MFKKVDFSEDTTPYVSDTEVGQNISPSTSRREGQAGNTAAMTMGSQSQDVISGITGSDSDSDDLPVFKRRPLSDTPIDTTFQSPETSQKSSPALSQAASLTRIDEHINAHLQESVEDTTPEGIVSPTKFSHPKRRPTTIDVPGLTKSKTSPDGLIAKEDSGSKLVIIMVGLPATGKSFITNKLSRFLNYSLYYCKVFNVGNTRRRFAKEHNLSDQDSKFFDPSNESSKQLRNQWALQTLDELLDYLLEGEGSVGIFDATNTTKCRRKLVLDAIRKRSPHLKILFLESICTNRAVVENNIKLKLFGPDYKGKNPEDSLKDFKERLSNYLTAYEPIEDDEDIQYIKMIDVGKKVIAYNIEGFLASQTVYYLLNFNLAVRQIWITRNGESQDNVKGKLGGNSHLTPRGRKYAEALAKFIDEQRSIFEEDQLAKRNNEGTIKDKDDIVQDTHSDSDNEGADHAFYVWTSMRSRAIETAQYFNEEEYPMKQMKMLDELSVGDYEGMTYAEIQAKHPEEFTKRQKDKIRYRYPGIAGESYMDVINRLRPVITELERIEDSTLIITHRVVARALLGYYMNLSVDIISNLDVPLHCIYCLEPKPYGITWTLWEYDEETDGFNKIPESDLNTTRVQEVGLVDKERRYSVVPTAPPSADLGPSDFLTKRRASVSFSHSGVHVSDNAEKPHGPDGERPQTEGGRATSTQVAFGSSNNSLFRARQPPGVSKIPKLANSSLLKNPGVNINNSAHTSELRDRFEIDKLNEKLSKLKVEMGSKNQGKENSTTSDVNEMGIPMTRSQSER